jgi:hypothetical protein
MHFLAQPPLGADAEAVADQQHPDHQLRIDRGPPVLAVKRRRSVVQKTQIGNTIDAAQKMIKGNVRFQVARKTAAREIPQAGPSSRILRPRRQQGRNNSPARLTTPTFQQHRDQATPANRRLGHLRA